MAGYKEYVVPVGNINLVMAAAKKGIVGCGLLDIAAFDKFGLAAAKVSGVSSIDDLLKAEIKAVNNKAQDLGIKAGMTGKEALELM